MRKTKVAPPLMTTKFIISAALWVAASQVGAAELTLPYGAVLSGENHEGFTSQKLPIGPFSNGEIPSIWAEGTRSFKAWQSENGNLTTLQMLSPLKEQLVDQDYQIIFECRDIDCGGFDFRYAQELLPEPQMHVDLSDFRFLAAQRMTEDTPEYISLFVSRNRTKGFLHVTTIGHEETTDLVPATFSTKSEPNEIFQIENDVLIGTLLERDGMAVLEDLNFEAGSAALQSIDFPSLKALADFLSANPTKRVTLVGHTDAVGSMEANFRVSKARANSVRQRLIGQFGISESQIDAQGVGYLAPLASNQSEDGRSLNRRVEVVLTSTD